MKSFKELMEKTKLLSTIDVPGVLGSFLEKRFGKLVVIVDTGKEYQITLKNEKLDGVDLKSLALNGLDGIEGKTLLLKLRK